MFCYTVIFHFSLPPINQIMNDSLVWLNPDIFSHIIKFIIKSSSIWLILNRKKENIRISSHLKQKYKSFLRQIMTSLYTVCHLIFLQYKATPYSWCSIDNTEINFTWAMCQRTPVNAHWIQMQHGCSVNSKWKQTDYWERDWHR